MADAALAAIDKLLEVLHASQTNNKEILLFKSRISSIFELLKAYQERVPEHVAGGMFDRLLTAANAAQKLYEEFSTQFALRKIVTSVHWQTKLSLLNDELDRCVMDLTMALTLAKEKRDATESEEKIALRRIRQLTNKLQEPIVYPEQKAELKGMSMSDHSQLVQVEVARAKMVVQNILRDLLLPMHRCGLLQTKSVADVNSLLQPLQTELESTTFRTCVIGPIKAGKSTLLNSIVGHEIAPHDLEKMTAMPTVIRHVASKKQDTEISMEIPNPDIFANDVMAFCEIKQELAKVAPESLEPGHWLQPYVGLEASLTPMEKEIWDNLENLTVPRNVEGLVEVHKWLKTINVLARMSMKNLSDSNSKWPSAFLEFLNQGNLSMINDSWPIVMCSFVFLEQHSALLPCNFEVVDTPGIDEHTIAEYLNVIVAGILKNSHAVVCVLDTTKLDSQGMAAAIKLSLGAAATNNSPDRLFDFCYFLGNKWDLAEQCDDSVEWENIEKSILRSISDQIKACCKHDRLSESQTSKIVKLRVEGLVSGKRIVKSIAKFASDVLRLRSIISNLDGKLPNFDFKKVDSKDKKNVSADERVVLDFGKFAFGRSAATRWKGFCNDTEEISARLKDLHDESGAAEVIASIFLRCAAQSNAERAVRALRELQGYVQLWCSVTNLALERLASDDSDREQLEKKIKKLCELYQNRKGETGDLIESQTALHKEVMQKCLKTEFGLRVEEMNQEINTLFTLHSEHCFELNEEKLNELSVGYRAESVGSKIGVVAAGLTLIPGALLALAHARKIKLDKNQLRAEYGGSRFLKFNNRALLAEKVNQFFSNCNKQFSEQTIRLQRALELHVMRWKEDFEVQLYALNEPGLDAMPTLEMGGRQRVTTIPHTLQYVVPLKGFEWSEAPQWRLYFQGLGFDLTLVRKVFRDPVISKKVQTILENALGNDFLTRPPPKPELVAPSAPPLIEEKKESLPTDGVVTILKRGHILKMANHSVGGYHMWNKRYLVLTKGELRYYNDETRVILKGICVLFGAAVSLVGGVYGKDCVVQIRRPDSSKAFVISGTVQECHDWVNAIEPETKTHRPIILEGELVYVKRANASIPVWGVLVPDAFHWYKQKGDCKLIGSVSFSAGGSVSRGTANSSGVIYVFGALADERFMFSPLELDIVTWEREMQVVIEQQKSLMVLDSSEAHDLRKEMHGLNNFPDFVTSLIILYVIGQASPNSSEQQWYYTSRANSELSLGPIGTSHLLGLLKSGEHVNQDCFVWVAPTWTPIKHVPVLVSQMSSSAVQLRGGVEIANLKASSMVNLLRKAIEGVNVRHECSFCKAKLYDLWFRCSTCEGVEMCSDCSRTLESRNMHTKDHPLLKARRLLDGNISTEAASTVAVVSTPQSPDPSHILSLAHKGSVHRLARWWIDDASNQGPSVLFQRDIKHEMQRMIQDNNDQAKREILKGLTEAATALTTNLFQRLIDQCEAAAQNVRTFHEGKEKQHAEMMKRLEDFDTVVNLLKLYGKQIPSIERTLAVQPLLKEDIDSELVDEVLSESAGATNITRHSG